MPSDATTPLSSIAVAGTGHAEPAIRPLPPLLSILIIAAVSSGLWWMIVQLVAMVCGGAATLP